jgi:hypothetical protein
MAGCFRNALAGVGCLTLLVVGGAVGWRYRAQVAGLYRSFRGPGVTVPTPDASVPGPAGATMDTAVSSGNPGAGTLVPAPAPARSPGPVAESPAPIGRPSDAALRAARGKEGAMERPDGPASVALTAAEMASLIEDGLDPVGRRALDSLEVVLAPDRLELRAALVTSNLGDLLGPFAAMFRPREPMRASGPARVTRPGVVAWEPDSFVVRAFPFPSELVPALVSRLTGGGGGAVPIRVPETVGDVRIAPGGVTFYRREDL